MTNTVNVTFTQRSWKYRYQKMSYCKQYYSILHYAVFTGVKWCFRYVYVNVSSITVS